MAHLRNPEWSCKDAQVSIPGAWPCAAAEPWRANGGKCVWRSTPTMPATIRLILVLMILGLLGYGTLYALGTVFEPESRQIIKPIPRDRFAD
jgi:hypothetical protein